MSAEGFVAVARECKVTAKESFAGNQGNQIYMITVQGWGFTRKFTVDQKADFDAWPAVGAVINVQCELEPTRDGTFKLVRPRFIEAKPGRASV